MINDELIDKVNERLIRRIEQGNEYVLEQIGKTLKKINGLKPTDAHKLVNILKYGGNYEKIANKLAKITNLNVKEIKKIFEQVAKSDLDFAKNFYNYRGVKFIPYEQNLELKNLVNSIANMTANEYLNISRSNAIGLGYVDKNKDIVFKGLKQAYNDIIDQAILNVSTGQETIDNALKRSLKEFDKGLKVIYPKTYIGKDGKKHPYTKRLDSALKQQMNDGLRQLHNEIQAQIGLDFDSDGVEVSVHSYPAIDHELVQGRQFSNEQFKKLQESGLAKDYTGKDINIHAIHKDGSYAVSHRPISQYNCYHYVFAIILGVNEPQYSDEQLNKIIQDNKDGFMLDGKHYTLYQGSQMQRQLELNIRDSKNYQIMAKASGNQQMIAESQQMVNKYTDKYNKLNQASGLPSKKRRLSVSGYRPVKLNRQGNSQPKASADLKYNAVVQSKEPKIALKDVKFAKTSKVFKASLDYIDLSNNDNIKIYNATDKLKIDIYERANIKKCEYSRFDKRIKTTSIRQGQENLVTPYADLWHELGHALDNHTMDKTYESNTEAIRTKMYDFYQDHKTIPDRIVEHLESYRKRTDAEFESQHNYQDYYNNYIEHKRQQGDSEWNLKVYKDRWDNDREDYNRMVERDYDYEKSLYYYNKNKIDMEYNQKSKLSDMFSAISKGKYNDFCEKYGWHTKSYFNDRVTSAPTELFADFVSLKMTNSKAHLDVFKEVAPELYDELDKLYKKIGDDLNA